MQKFVQFIHKIEPLQTEKGYDQASCSDVVIHCLLPANSKNSKNHPYSSMERHQGSMGTGGQHGYTLDTWRHGLSLYMGWHKQTLLISPYSPGNQATKSEIHSSRVWDALLLITETHKVLRKARTFSHPAHCIMANSFLQLQIPC